MSVKGQAHATETRLASLVAFYGRQPDSFSDLVDEVQQQLRVAFPAGCYTPYSRGQIHATIMRLGTSPEFDLRDCEFRSLMSHIYKGVHSSATLPFSVQFGGYRRNRDYGFESRGQHPYNRSFEVRDDRVVFIGWPTRRDRSGMTPLGRLRMELEKRGFVHKYSSGAGIDNDMYVTLGTICRSSVSDEVAPVITGRIRAMLAARRSVVTLGLDDLVVVSYSDKTLPVDSTLVRAV
jgi:hypothetical protein